MFRSGDKYKNIARGQVSNIPVTDEKKTLVDKPKPAVQKPKTTAHKPNNNSLATRNHKMDHTGCL